MVDKSHHYFTNPKYVYTHVCQEVDGMWMVFECGKYEGDYKHKVCKPVAMGTSQGEAIENASSMKGIKHYMIRVIE